VFGGVIALGALWLKSVKAPPTIFVLKIASAAGEVEGLRSYDANLINAVAAAITQAITHRG
jgi:hypothetical protein